MTHSHHNIPEEPTPWADERLLHYYLMKESKKYKRPTIGLLYGQECCREESITTIKLGWTNATWLASRPLTPFDQKCYQGWHRVRLSCFNSLTAFIYWELEDLNASISWVAELVNRVLSYPDLPVTLGIFDVEAWQRCQTPEQQEALLRANHAYVCGKPGTYILAA